ncbi:MAG: hypothetical protein ACXWUY_08035 [Telluria sp.]
MAFQVEPAVRSLGAAAGHALERFAAIAEHAAHGRQAGRAGA